MHQIGDVVNKCVVRRYLCGVINVVEGDVLTDRGEVTFCWVEEEGVRITGYIDIDQAMDAADRAAEEWGVSEDDDLGWEEDEEDEDES